MCPHLHGVMEFIFLLMCTFTCECLKMLKFITRSVSAKKSIILSITRLAAKPTECVVPTHYWHHYNHFSLRIHNSTIVLFLKFLLTRRNKKLLIKKITQFISEWKMFSLFYLILCQFLQRSPLCRVYFLYTQALETSRKV